MIAFTTQLYDEMERNIRTIKSDEKDILKCVHLTARMLDELLGRLKTFIVNYSFQNDDEEILFFKEIKPRFFSQLLFYVKVYNVEMNRPMGSLELQSAYLSRELDNISRYVSKRLDFYRYYRSGSSSRDHLYFKRGVMSWNEQYVDGSYFERDPMFSSACDFTVSKIHSYDMLQIYLQEELENISEHRVRLRETSERRVDAIRWTSKKAFLIQIIYSLDTLGTFENGDLSLRKLQEHFETHYDIKLGNIARAMNEMRTRQNPVIYLDMMREALLKRMEDAEEKANTNYFRSRQ